MISPEEILARAIRLWDTHQVQRTHLEGTSFFPWSINVPAPKASELAEDFPRLRAAIQKLEKGAKASGGAYDIVYAQVNHRRLGKQLLPRKIVVACLDDFLSLTGKRRQHERFADVVGRILAELPELKPVLCGRPAVVLEHLDDWPGLLAVCKYFQRNPRPDVYLRQLNIPGVDTKFIETRRSIIAEVLSAVLPAEVLAATTRSLSDRGFEERFGLRVEPPLIRLRTLDGKLSGVTDISVPLSELAELSLRPRRVFMTENKMNGLTFPRCREAVVIFGLGYGATSLAEVPWLRDAEVHYWGDCDTHGFAILSQLRQHLPASLSFLMDEATFLTHRSLWGTELESQRFSGDLSGLTNEELGLFQGLRENRWGKNVRLEQERIAFAHVLEQVAKIAP